MKNPTAIQSWVNKVKRGETLESQTGKAPSAAKTKWPRKTFKSIEEELLYVKAERDYLKKLYRSLYGKEWGNDTELVTSTLRRLKLPRKKAVMMHSDQGFQFTSCEYRNELHALQWHGSHSRKGNCYDNACIESFFSHFKTEALASFGKKPRTEEKVKSIVHEYVHFYNTERFQKRLGQLSPVEYRKKHARLSVGLL